MERKKQNDNVIANIKEVFKTCLPKHQIVGLKKFSTIQIQCLLKADSNIYQL